MAEKFHGTLEVLQAAVAALPGYAGNWTEDGGRHSFRAARGEILNWWPRTGTLQFQGRNAEVFKPALSAALDTEDQQTPKEPAAAPRKIFVVHGHDGEARDQLELALGRLGLESFILQNTNDQSSAIIEALEKNIYQEAAFGIVLLTPDDFGYSKADGEDEKQPRARQNAILEMGMVMASLGRDKMVILKKGALEMPSDADGIPRADFNDHIREVVPKLVRRLQNAGFEIDPAKIANASS